MKNLVIIGAGGFGREICAAAREACGYGTVFGVKGFLDADPGALARFSGYPPVVGAPETYAPEPDDVFIVAIGNMAVRMRIADMIGKRGGRFIPVVHRSASLGPGVTVGEGSFVSHNAVLTVDVRVGRHACIFQGSVLGHDSSVGDFGMVYSLCSIGGGVCIGSGAAVYPGSRIAPRRKVGDRAVVGIGSVVLLDVPAGTTVFGNPAAPADIPA